MFVSVQKDGVKIDAFHEILRKCIWDELRLCSNMADHFWAWLVMGFPVASLWTLGGGVLVFLSLTDLTFTILAWMPQPMQYCILM